MRNLGIRFMVAFGVLCAGAVRADDKNDFAPVPQTGQTTCYDSEGIPLTSCTGTGQDGEFQKGVDLPTPRFTDKGDGTIKDNLTGLIWLKNANCIHTDYPSFDNDPNHDSTAGDGMVNWQHALDFVAGINDGTYHCGDTSGKRGTQRTDWRLPNIRELFSLIDFAFGYPNAAISNAAGNGPCAPPDCAFTNFPVGLGNGGGYWSATTIEARQGGVHDPNYAWVVKFDGGDVSPSHKPNEVNYVLAVRGGS
jgi:hypothetical protein